MNLLVAERRKQFRDSPAGSARRNRQQTRQMPRSGSARRSQKLDDSEREILMLREYEQLSYAEIAELLNLPVNTVRSRLFRSRMTLKGYLDPERNAVAAGEVSENLKLGRPEGEAV